MLIPPLRLIGALLCCAIALLVQAAPSPKGEDARMYWTRHGYATEELAAGPVSGVSAELGGAGFESLAASLGFVTNADGQAPGDPLARPGGVLRVPLHGFPASLCPLARTGAEHFQTLAAGLLHETLLGGDAWSGFHTPKLASHWKIEADSALGQWISFRLDPKARWQTGQRVTAEDVRATWRLLTDESLGQPSVSAEYRQLAEPQVLSPHLVRIHCSSRSLSAFQNLAFLMPVLPAHLVDGLSARDVLER